MPPISTHQIRELLLHNSTVATTEPEAGLHVVCAWPVSGQYGPGSRVLYYVLVAACVFGKKTDWLKSACLAAVLLFPAVAALHAITLAALHVDGAVDMDIYGAFQLCSLGILAAPVTARHSRTYFLDPGRNIIFLWTGLILAGLLSLAVEFFRTATTTCKFNDFSTHSIDNFNQGNPCGLRCSVEDGPTSPMRRGAADNIYIIPIPDRLTFNTVTLLSAACCIPAILSLISMWNKILEINWKSRSGIVTEKDPNEKRVEGIDAWIRFLLGAVEAPLFGIAVIAILVLGERNLFSPQVRYGTEPIASIGQWAPIVGTGLAVLGSLTVNLTKTTTELEDNSDSDQPNQSVSNCSCGCGVHSSAEHIEDSRTRSSEIVPVRSRPSMASNLTSDRGNRRKVAEIMTTIANYMGTPGHGQFDNSAFRRDARDYPTVPGEDGRNPKLPQTEQRYNHSSERLSRSPSRASDLHMTTAFPPTAAPQRTRSSSLGQSSVDSQDPPSPLSTPPAGNVQPTRRDMLEVPPQAHVPSREMLERSRGYG